MTVSEPVSRVIKFLEPCGYRLFPAPLMISGMTFTFPAVLAGPENTSDLVLVVDTAETDDNDNILRQVLGVGRALDIARKSNPLTTIIVGPRPSQSLISEMMSVCRVLPIGTLPAKDADKVLANWLAVLTPLVSFEGGIVVDPLRELRIGIAGLREDVAAIANCADEGSGAVEEAINRILIGELEEAWESEA